MKNNWQPYAIGLMFGLMVACLLTIEDQLKYIRELKNANDELSTKVSLQQQRLENSYRENNKLHCQLDTEKALREVLK